MKFAVSNIAWTPAEPPAVLELLRREGITGIEVVRQNPR